MMKTRNAVTDLPSLDCMNAFSILRYEVFDLTFADFLCIAVVLYVWIYIGFGYELAFCLLRRKQQEQHRPHVRPCYARPARKGKNHTSRGFSLCTRMFGNVLAVSSQRFRPLTPKGALLRAAAQFSLCTRMFGNVLAVSSSKYT
jgi:hypothetical protein